jgi:hypothetical protein
MQSEINTHLLPIEGKDIDPPRDQRLLVIEVATTSTNGCSVGGSATLQKGGGEYFLSPPQILPDGTIQPSVARMQIYADNLGVVLSQVRTPEHDEALRQSRDAAEAARVAWLNDEVRSTEQRRMQQQTASDGRGTRLDEYMRNRCPINEWTVLSTATKFRTGLPPLLYCKVVDHEGVAHDLGELDKDPSRFLLDAPPTADNRTRAANENLASTMAEALGRLGLGAAPNAAQSAEIAELRTQNAELKAQMSRIEAMLEKRGGNRNDNR